MSVFRTIFTIAVYEAKILLRSWFFRIFALLFLLLIGFFDATFFVLERSARWAFLGMPAGLPYANMLFLNVLQSIVAIFLASDFLKFDRKLDTTDVIYMRSMTNVSYVLGKIIGVLIVFCLLDLAVLAVAGVINVFFAESPFIPLAYAAYPLLICLPSLVFIFGLTFLLMVLVRSQAMVFVLMLGYIASVLFFLQNNLFRLFDFTGFSLPLAWSDFVGLNNIHVVLFQRGFYLLLGVALVLVTALLIRRLPQNRVASYLSAAVALVCLAGAVFLGHRYVLSFERGIALRQAIRQVNARYESLSPLAVTSERIELEHRGKSISAVSSLILRNPGQAPIERYRFTLNPGLRVESVTRNGADIPFERQEQLVLVSPAAALSPGLDDSVTIRYAGGIDQEACYLDISDSAHVAPNTSAFFSLAKQYCFVDPDYLLLTPEVYWYPSPDLPESNLPVGSSRYFTRFSLKVKTAPGLNSVGPGVRDSLGGGVYTFTPEEPLPRLHVAAGHYDKLSLTTDSLEYALYILRGHDFFSQYFKDLGEDKLKEALSGFLRQEDRHLDIRYPYPRISLLETPVQYYAYTRPWSLAPATIQPEQVLVPEKGVTLQGLDFRLMSYYMGGRGGDRRGGRNRSPEEIQTNLLRQFLNNFSSNMNQGRQVRAFRRSSGGSFSLMNIAFSLFAAFDTDRSYVIFPYFYNLTNHMSSGRWPVFDLAFQNYLRSLMVSSPPAFLQMLWGPSASEEANILLAEHSLSEILADSAYAAQRNEVLSAKTDQLFGMVESRAGEKPFRSFVHDFLTAHRYQDCSAQVFLDSLRNRLGINLEPDLDEWLNSRRVASFLFGAPEIREILDGDKTRYQITLEVSNQGDGDGLLEIDTGGGGGGRGGFFGEGGGDEEPPRLYRVAAGEGKVIGLVEDEATDDFNVDTHVSRNMPARLMFRLGKPLEDHAAKPFEGERALTGPIVLDEPGTVIVDNEDLGFKVARRQSDGWLKSLLSAPPSNGDRYEGIYFWNPPRRWVPTTFSDFYGLYRRSARYIKGGDGENKVSWTGELPKNGQYDVYYHVTEIRMPWGRHRGNDDEMVQDLHFTVHHDDGADEVKLDAGQEKTGWVLLNTWYFSKGAATVELSDLSKGRIVYADAVKWSEHNGKN